MPRPRRRERALCRPRRGGRPGDAGATCRGWSLSSVRHVGRGDLWAATTSRTGLPADPREVADGRPPEGGLVDRLQGGPQAILTPWPRRVRTPRSTFNAPVPRPGGSAGASTRCWCTGPTPRSPSGPTSWFPPSVRPTRLRMARSVGGAAVRAADNPLADGATLHLHATDDGLGRAGEWFVRGAGERIAWEDGHAEATSPSAIPWPTSCSRRCAATVRHGRDDRDAPCGSAGRQTASSAARGAAGTRAPRRPAPAPPTRPARRPWRGWVARVEQAEEHRAQPRHPDGAAELLVRVQHAGRRADQRQRDARQRDVEERRHGQAQPEAAHGQLGCERPARHLACHGDGQQHAAEPRRRHDRADLQPRAAEAGGQHRTRQRRARGDPQRPRRLR